MTLTLDHKKAPRVQASIKTILVLGIGMLVLVAVLSTLIVAMVASGASTLKLLRDKGDLVLHSVEQQIAGHFDPVARAATFLADEVVGGDIGFHDTAQMIESLETTLAMVPQATGVAVVAPDGLAIRMARVQGQLHAETGRLDPDSVLRPAVPAVGEVAGLTWGPIYNDEIFDAPLATAGVAARDGDTILATILIGTSLEAFSDFLKGLLEEQGIRAFVLHDRSAVLAHPALADLGFSGFRSYPNGLPRISDLPDDSLRGLDLSALGRKDNTVEVPDGRSFSIAESEDGVFLLRDYERMGNAPWIIGLELDEREILDQIFRFLTAILIGLGILVVAIAIGFVISVGISRRLRALAAASDLVTRLDFAHVPLLPGSRVTEIAAAHEAFNAMVTGLRWFESYVPKRLAERLIRAGDRDALPSEMRVVTLMFTDLRGFTSATETQSPEDTGRYLDDHFSSVSRIIEETEGTVDKFMGDAVMAFWGAPEGHEDHAARAVAAARQIAREHRSLEAKRPEAARLGLRIALFTGTALVGNIGPRSRLNFTAVGDSVNAAARLCAIAKTLMPADALTVIVADDRTCTEAGVAENDRRDAGTHTLRGRRQPRSVMTLFDDDR